MFIQLIDLIFRIFKIVLLSAVYTTLIFALLAFFFRHTRSQWLANRARHYVKNWLLTHFLISAAFLAYSFSYWQDTGLGDAPKLPIGYGQTIYSPDFEWTIFYPDPEKTDPNKDELPIGHFKVNDHWLCAEVSHQYTSSPEFDFLVYDLSQKKLMAFRHEADYSVFAQNNHLPKKAELYDFETHLREYRDRKPKWQRWLLP